MQVTFEPLVYPERWCVSLEQELTALVDDVIFKPLNDIVEVVRAISLPRKMVRFS